MSIHVSHRDLSAMEDEIVAKMDDVMNLPGSKYQYVMHKYGGCISCWEQINDALDNIYAKIRGNHGK